MSNSASFALGSTRNRHPASSRSARSPRRDRKSTRLNSSHVRISYAVFCLKKKKKMTSTKQNKNQPAVTRANDSAHSLFMLSMQDIVKTHNSSQRQNIILI